MTGAYQNLVSITGTRGRMPEAVQEQTRNSGDISSEIRKVIRRGMPETLQEGKGSGGLKRRDSGVGTSWGDA